MFLLTSRWCPSEQGVTDRVSRNIHVIDWEEVKIVDRESDQIEQEN